MKKPTYLFIILGALLIAALACNLPIQSRAVGEIDQDESIELTVAAEVEAGEEHPVIQPPPETEAPPTQTPTITETPTVTPTFTPSIPMASVSQNTNCRTGPGTEYDLVYIFMVGDEAEIVARSSVPNYVIVEVPDGSGRECWLWMQYGSQTGDTSGLPEETPPPTPTPKATPTPELDFKLTFDSVADCFGSAAVFVKITNTGGVTLESFNYTATNQDTSQTVSNTVEVFSPSATCVTLSPKQVLNPGEYGFMAAGFTPPIGGHTIKFTIKVCAGSGASEPCRTKYIAAAIPNVSDVHAKENFAPVDSIEVLQLLSELPITSWSYIDPNREGRHIGPMAQDFHQIFGVGESDEYINSVDSYGVALAAIQALSEITEGQADRITTLETSNRALQDQNEALIERLDALEAQEVQKTRLSWALLIVVPSTGLCLVLWFRRKSSDASCEEDL
jgi:hypothetical protein